jgi:hypothetical protein
MTNGSAGIDQFIVAHAAATQQPNWQRSEQALPEFPNATILSRGGRPEQPSVVTLPENAFEQLQSRFGASPIIERTLAQPTTHSQRSQAIGARP